jgi:hypothetical protein
MATRIASEVTISPGVRIVTWTGLLNGDDGAWIDVGPYADINIEIYGTMGVGGRITAHGTNDTTSTPAAASIMPLPDSTDTLIDLSVARWKQVLVAPLRIRPAVTAGDGTTTLTMKMKLTTPARR